MPDADPNRSSPASRWLPRLAGLLGAVLGAIYSYDFGAIIGGPLVGVVLALNGAVFASVVVGALAERLCNGWRAAQVPSRRAAG